MSDFSELPKIWNGPKKAEVLVILAHGAGAPMDTEFMDFFAENISKLNVKILRFEFPYMALRRQGHGKRPPNPQKILLSTWRQIIEDCRTNHAGKVVIGGKSMGGRMASLIADECSVDGLICLGYPFYAPGKQDKPRTDHLISIKTPYLICQGERDPMGSKEVVDQYSLSNSIKFSWFTDGNHDLRPRKTSGLKHSDHLEASISAISTFLKSLNSK